MEPRAETPSGLHMVSSTPRGNPPVSPSTEPPPATQGTRWLLGRGSCYGDQVRTPSQQRPGATCISWEEPQRCSHLWHPPRSPVTVKFSTSCLLLCIAPLSWHQWELTYAPHNHKVWPLSNTQLFCWLPYTQLAPGQLQNASTPFTPLSQGTSPILETYPRSALLTDLTASAEILQGDSFWTAQGSLVQ